MAGETAGIEKPRAAPDAGGGLTPAQMVEAALIANADPKTGFGILKGHLPDRGGSLEIRLAPAARNAPPNLE